MALMNKNQPFPGLYVPFVEEDRDDPGAGRKLSRPWYRFMITVWRYVSNVPGAAPQIQAPTFSPFVFTASFTGGVLGVSSGRVEVSRDGGATFYTVSPNGGMIPLVFGDQARVTWSTATPPSVVFFPPGGITNA